MTVGIPYDSTRYIEDAIHEVLKTLGETLLIVVLVIFLFLGSVRGLIIPVVAIPISLIGAVFLMKTFGFTINLLTLLAIVLSVGTGGRRRDRHGREHRAPPARGPEAARRPRSWRRASWSGRSSR